MMDLNGKIALVTGGARGIGEATCHALAAQGARIAVTARTQASAESVAKAVREKHGVDALGLACEMGDSASIGAAVAAVEGGLGPVDILISNAGMVDPIGLIREIDPQAWAGAIEVNLIGPMRMLRALLPGMVARGAGVVVHLSSGAAHNPMEGWSAYCAAKAGLAMLTRSLALEYGAAGIRAYGLSPGVIDTGMQATIRASGINRVSKIPRENLASPADPARAIAFLCGPGGQPYAGQEIDFRTPEFRAACGL